MRKQASVRLRRSEAEWSRIFERQRSSGLSEAAFCRREGLSKNTFGCWKQKLGSRRGAQSSRPVFVEWPVATEADPTPGVVGGRGFGELELILPGGGVLRWKS